MAEHGTAEAKRRLRAEMRRRSDDMTGDEARESGRMIAREVLASAEWRTAESVFVYVSVGKEPDTRDLIAAALAEGKRVYVPKCLPRPERVMLAVRIESTDALEAGAFGIPEPQKDGAETAGALDLDLILVPCVTANRRGERLGHGAGYYDRFLAPLAPIRKGEKRPAVFCLCHSALLTERIPTDEYDIPADRTITGENGRNRKEDLCSDPPAGGGCWIPAETR